MPFAQFGYPHLSASREVFDQAFPADFIVEAIDQTRGWFYSLMAVSTLLFDRNSYRTVLCLGHIVDADGKKMSKSLGNILEPWDLISTRGADALRWLLLTDGSPWVPRRVGPQPLDEVVRRFLLTLWNAYYFFATYARLEGWAPDPDPGRGSGGVPPVGERPVLDRWVLAELADTVEVVDAGLEAYDTTTAGRRVASFVDDLSNWYIRRSRARFWSADPSAFATLHECLVTIAALLAPFTPFVADELYENLVRAVDRHAPDSVHLLDFPVADKDAVDERLRAAMAGARRVVELGRRARNEARVAVRQPLRRAVVTLPAEERAGWEQVREVVADELNVKAIDLAERAGGLVTYRLKPNFRALGPDFGGRTPAVAAAIAGAEAEAVAAALAADGSAEIGVDGELVRVRAEQVQVSEDARTGWQVAREEAYSVALDLDIDQALRQEGLARELVRAVNDLRKRLGLELDDRVELEVAADGEVAEALAAHREAIAAEVLATALRAGPAEEGEELDLGGRGRLRVLVRVRS
jgi:isoleucyl-tRNA synthetase